MNNSIRGIECTLNENAITELVKNIFLQDFVCFVPWCMVNNNEHIINYQSMYLNAESINNLVVSSVWELVLYIYPQNEVATKTVYTYDEFINSNCSCCLLYYDCGILEIYIKEPELFQKVWEVLAVLHAQDMVIKTAINDGRFILCL